MKTFTVPWYPELITAPVPQLPGIALHFVWVAAILSRKLGPVSTVEFNRELTLILAPLTSAKDLCEGSLRTAAILGLIVISRGIAYPGEALLATRPWWEH